MPVITKQLMTLAICSKLADVRENKGNAMPIQKPTKHCGTLVQARKDAQAEEIKTARSNHALKLAH
jgi:hypothetical protein